MDQTARLLASQPGACPIPALPPGVQLVTLDNGLTLILREDRSAPVVSVQAWCMTGSVHEGRWLGSGVSHVLEHMLFKGTPSRSPGDIDLEVQSAGGYLNAFTSFDRTVYYINAPNTGVGTAIDVLCDIMQHATLPAEELAKEKQVILREMDMNQDDPARRSSRRLFETAYTVSPYRYTVIGYPDIYHELTRADILTYYQERYVPNNMFLVVVGDVRRADAERQIRSAFAGGKARALAPIYLPDEPPQMATREVIEEAPIELAHFHLSWHVPDLRHPDIPILDVLATLLGNGRSSRLYQHVREKAGLVHSVDAWTYSPGAPGLFGLSALAEGQNFAAASAAMLEQVERMKIQAVPQPELAKAVKQFVAGTLATRKTMQGQAQDLGSNWMAAGDLNFSERYLEAVKRVTPEELQRVAWKYLTAENRTLVALLPQGKSPCVTLTVDLHEDHPIQKMELPNGLRLLVKEDRRLPFVEFRAVFKGGVLSETAANNGLTVLLSKMLLKGTQRRSAEDVAREIESVGGHLDTYGGNNSLGLSAEVLNDDFAIGLDLLFDVLLRPAFPPDALDLEKELQLASIKALRDQVLHCGSQAMRRCLFGDHGYGLDLNGSEVSVPSLKVHDLQSMHRQLVAPNNCVLAIYGHVVTEEVRAAVEKTVASWPARPLPSAPEPPSPIPRPTHRVLEPRDKKQAVIVIGYPGTTLFDSDRFALELLQEACSDLGSRLFTRIREKLGLAYYVGAQNFLGLVPGYFAFYAGTSPEKAEAVEQEIIQEAALLCAEGLTDAELQRAKAKLIGHKKIARQDLGSYAMTTALDELYGLGFGATEAEDAYFAAVTLADLQEVARKYLRPEVRVVAVVRPD